MTSESRLPDLAVPYALDAVSGAERADIERLLAEAPDDVADAFRAEVRYVREALAATSATSALAPPGALRGRVLRTAEPRRRFAWRRVVLAAAAAVVIGVGGFGVGLALRPAPTTADQVFSASDVRSVSDATTAGGTATFVYSRDRDAGVLLLNNVEAPAPGMVYQFWLMTGAGPQSAGMVGQVSSSTTVMMPDLGSPTAVSFTMEPAGGSQRPTGDMVARLSLA